MTDKEVCRYIDLVDRRVFIITHSGVDWKPEYSAELEAIDRELTELRKKVDREYRQKEERKMKPYRVKYWHPNEDGGEEFVEFEPWEVAKIFYDSLGGRAEIQRYVEEIHDYEVVVFPTFDV